MEKDTPYKWKSNEVAIFISDKTDFKIKTVIKDKEGLLNDHGINPRRRYYNCKYICTQHRSTSTIRQMLITIKGEIYSNTITPLDFNTPLLSMDKSSRQNINKETQALNDTSDQILD